MSEAVFSPYNATFSNKLSYALIGVIAFILVSSPEAYHHSGFLFNTINDKCPLPEGKLLHSLLFFAILYFATKIFVSRHITYPTLSNDHVAKYAFYGTLMFFLISSSDAYAITRKLVSSTIVNSQGCPEFSGILLHSVLFFVLFLLTLYLPKDSCNESFGCNSENRSCDEMSGNKEDCLCSRFCGYCDETKKCVANDPNTNTPLFLDQAECGSKYLYGDLEFTLEGAKKENTDVNSKIDQDYCEDCSSVGKDKCQTCYNCGQCDNQCVDGDETGPYFTDLGTCNKYTFNNKVVK